MTLKQIEFYEAVCQAGNATAAAQQLYVSRSVISRAIQELEDELDIQLFVRCLLYTSPSPRDLSTSRMPSSA